GGGDVGESLFDAGAGGHGVRRVLERLEADADKGFKPRGRHASINDLLERYKLARKRVSDALLPPAADVAQTHGLEPARIACDELKRQLSELREERFRKRELLAALKSIARRSQLLSELERLGALPNIDEAFVERRERAQATIAEQRGVLGVVDQELLRLSA